MRNAKYLDFIFNTVNYLMLSHILVLESIGNILTGLHISR